MKAAAGYVPLAGLLPILTLAGAAAAQQPLPLDTLHATGSRALAGAAAATRSVDVLTRAQIEALPARTVGDVLARALGVDVQARSPAQADLALRGSSTEQVLVLVDGVPVNDDQTGHFHLDVAVPLESIERIEIVRGPASALYGSAAVGGVVNVITRRQPHEVAARAQAGSFGSAAAGLEAASSLRGVTARAGLEHDRSDGHRSGTDHRITQARLALNAPVVGGSARADFGFAARDFGADAFYAPFNSYEETRTTTAALSWRGQTRGIAIEPRVSVRRHQDDFILRRDDPAFYRNVHDNRAAAAELVLRWAPARRWHTAAGVEARRSSIESTALGERAEWQQALFAELGVGSVESALATLGARVDHHSVFGTYVSPSLAAGYSVSERVRLRAAAASGFRAPSWTERFYRDPANVGTPDLAAEQFWTAEAGLALEPAAGARLDMAAFVRHATDLIDWTRPAGQPKEPWRTLNVSEATFRGLEARLQLALGRGAMTSRAALLGFDADAAAGYTSKYALRPLTRSFSVEAVAPAAGVQLGARAAHFRRADGSSWSVVDARASRAIAGVDAFLDVTNLLDASYRDVVDRSAPGRAVHMGVRLRRQTRLGVEQTTCM